MAQEPGSSVTRARISVTRNLCIAGLLASCLLGGGTRSGFLADAALQLLAIPVLICALWTLRGCKFPHGIWLAWLVWLGLGLVFLAQLIPLPPSMWLALPQRSQVAEILGLAGQELPWLPMSVVPQATALAALSLIPPLAVFVAAIQLDLRQRRQVSLVLLGFAIVSVFLGLAQLSQGAGSALRFYAFTNTDDSVGFFANRNHFSTSLFTFLLIAVVWVLETVRSTEALPPHRQFETRAIVWVVLGVVAVVLLLLGQVMTRSRAGLGLTIVALFGALALALIDRERLAKLTPTKILAGAVALAVVASTQYTLFRVIERFASDPVKDDRVLFARNTFEAAKAFMPFGSGVGTFVPVYALFERPEFALLDKYANRAHNDALEMWLETGLAGLLAFAIFVSWFASRAVIAWVRPNPDGLKVDHALARAATIAIVLILAHSAFDYPLRTNAMMAVFAFLCALLIAPPIGSESPAAVAAAAIEAEQRLSRPRQRREPVAGEPVAVRPDLAWPTQDTQPAEAEAAQEAQTARGARWGDAIEWPDEWRTNDQPGAARGSPPTKKP